MLCCDKFLVVRESAKPGLLVITSKVLSKGPLKMCIDYCVWFMPISWIETDTPGLMVGSGPKSPSLIACTTSGKYIGSNVSSVLVLQRKYGGHLSSAAPAGHREDVE